MENDAEPEDLKSLGRRVRQAQGKTGDTNQAGEPAMHLGALYGVAWRMVIELAVVPMICGAFGWWLDKQLGSKPWLMLLLALAGCVIGGINVYRIAARQQRADNADGILSGQKNEKIENGAPAPPQRKE